MSVSQHLYIGPYVMIKNDKYKDVEDEKYCCPNRDCKWFFISVTSSQKFCSTCGFELKTISQKKQKLINPFWDIFQKEFVDSFFQADLCGKELVPGYCILGANKIDKDGGLPKLSINSDEVAVYDFRERNSNHEILLFQTIFHKEFELLKGEGFEFTFHWGMLIYFS